MSLREFRIIIIEYVGRYCRDAREAHSISINNVEPATLP